MKFMSFWRLLGKQHRGSSKKRRGTRGRTRKHQDTARPWLEHLEERAVPAQLAIHDTSALEGNAGTTSAVFEVDILEGRQNQDITVSYTTVNGTATAGSDYQSVTGVLTIRAGSTFGTIAVPV